MGEAAQKIGSSAERTVQIEVDLNTSENPPVRVSDRRKKVAKGSTIKWKKASGAPNFVFTYNDLDNPPFEHVVMSDNKIECDFDNDKPKDWEFKYELRVMFDRKTYSTTEQKGDPQGDKAVIRNEG